jgi:hypothetical protein
VAKEIFGPTPPGAAGAGVAGAGGAAGTGGASAAKSAAPLMKTEIPKISLLVNIFIFCDKIAVHYRRTLPLWKVEILNIRIDHKVSFRRNHERSEGRF